MPHPAARILRDDVASAFALLTRLPVPAHAFRGGAAAWAWPVAGAAVGAAAGAGGAAALALGLPPGAAAVVTLAGGAALTGALHEDGLADTFDGLWGGRTPAARLAIMKDSRVGSYGVLALVLVALARWSALASLAAAGGLVAAAAAAGALSRAPMAAIMAVLPNARGSGLSQATGRPSRRTAALAAALALAVALLLAGPAALPAALAAAAAALWLAAAARRRIGGQTGDILGGAQQLAEAAALIALAAAFA